MAVPITTLTRSQFAQFLPNEMAIRWAESLQSAASSFVPPPPPPPAPALHQLVDMLVSAGTITVAQGDTIKAA